MIVSIRNLELANAMQIPPFQICSLRINREQDEKMRLPTAALPHRLRRASRTAVNRKISQIEQFGEIELERLLQHTAPSDKFGGEIVGGFFFFLVLLIFRIGNASGEYSELSSHTILNRKCGRCGKIKFGTVPGASSNSGSRWDSQTVMCGHD